MTQPFRTPRGGLIDRDRPVAFRFDNQALTGVTGDTLASALLANGVHLLGRSFKYHRRRGIFGAGTEEPNALVQIRVGDRTEPNLRATRVELFDGLVAKSQNRWPSLEFDVGAVNNLMSRLLPAGFYYKTFMWPGGWWKFYEGWIRRAAGLGEAPRLPDPDRYEKRFAHCDVLVVGAGPAGLAAARAAARSGARVILVDEDFRPGGGLLKETREIENLQAAGWAEAVAAELSDAKNVRVLPRSTAFGYYDANLVAVAERVADHLPLPGNFQPRQRIWWVRARRVVLATGAIERPLVFANNDLPGIMLASAAETYARRFAVRCGQRAVLFTNNDCGYSVVSALTDAGARVAAVVDSRGTGPGVSAKKQISALGVPCYDGHVVVRAHGGTAVRAVSVCARNTTDSFSTGPEELIDCDLLCVSGGFNPAVHLFSQSQGKLRYDPELASFVPDVSRQAERSAGAARGRLELQEALTDGDEAGREAARACGFKPARGASPTAAADAAGSAPMEPLWLVPLPGGRHDKQFVDLQNDVTVADIALAIREGYSSVEHLKRYTTLGMGTDQGRTSNVIGAALLAATLDTDMSAVGTTTFRPPYAPVALGALGGREVGEDFEPIRRSPMHEWHARAGARFVTAGLWLRPQYYAKPGEDMMDAINREAVAVRENVGMVDVSTLGKIDVQGRDAAEFLERVCINRFANLKLGRCRYYVMLREDGFIFDDGTVTRIGEDAYYMTTTTANAGPVLAHLEFYAQTVWPELRVCLTSVSDQWAAIAVAGPESRNLLARACSDDVGNHELPFMGYLESRIGGAPARIFRITFSGELAYEVHTPACFGEHVWETMIEAGMPFEVTPYGTEALSVLRIEKGHVVAAELDGRTIPSDFGFEVMIRKSTDFVGRRSLDRPALEKSRRHRFVGLISEDGRHIPRGAQLVWNPATSRPVHMLGHVTSTCYSPNLKREIALALLADAERYRGGVLYAASPLAGTYVPVRVTDHVFIDPEGQRARG